MAGVAFRFTLDDGELQRQVDALGRRAANAKAAFDDIGLDMVAITERAFQDQRSPEGMPWAPSAAALAEGRQTLTDSKVLRGSFSYVAGESGVVFGTNVPYAALHQFGGTVQPRGATAVPVSIEDDRDLARAVVTFPPRPFVGASERDVRRWEATLADYLAGDDASGGAP